MIPMLVASRDFPEVETVEVEAQSVIVSGTITGETEAETMERLSALRRGLESYCRKATIEEEKNAVEGRSFRIKLENMSDFVAYLGSKQMVTVHPIGGRIWQMANEKRRMGEYYSQQNEFRASEKSYNQAAKLYARASKIAKLKKVMTMLESRLLAVRNKTKNLDFPDMVVLKRGERIKCEIISENADTIRIRTSVGIARLPKDKIESLVRASGRETEKISRTESTIEEIHKRKGELKTQIDDLHLLSIRNSAETLAPETD
jgi:chorismate-pyruvate lyase